MTRHAFRFSVWAMAVSVSAAWADDPPAASAKVDPPDRSILLARDPIIQTALGLKPAQITQVGALMDATDAQLWTVNPLPPAEGSQKARQILTDTEAKLDPILTAPQRTRFREIRLQYRGFPAVLSPEMDSVFKLTESQRSTIRRSVDKTQDSLTKIDQLARAGKSQEFLQKASRAVRAELRDDIFKVLTDEQKATWQQLTGKPMSFTKVSAPVLRAPEFRDTGQWINAEPLTLAGLRGHVVMVHFYTFGCSNCIHNYPAYKAWTSTLVPKGLTIVGIHTPETQGEHNVDTVKAKAKESGLKFPILVDNERKNWNAWGNGMWPSVYLIDKQGYVRYWWFGELNWQGAQGQVVMGKYIEQLLAEKVPTTAPATVTSAALKKAD